MLVNEIIQNKEEFFKFLMYASQFYKANYYTLKNVLKLYNLFPNGTIFATFDDWNNIGARIKKGEHGFRLYIDNFQIIIFDVSQTRGVKVSVKEFNKQKLPNVIKEIENTMNISTINKKNYHYIFSNGS